MGELINLRPDVPQAAANHEAVPVINTEYATSMTADIISTFSELGVADEFLPIVSNHLSDLQLVMSTTATASHLDVGCSIRQNERRSTWNRRAVISMTQFKQYQQAISDTFEIFKRGDDLVGEVAPVVAIGGDNLDDGSRKSLVSVDYALDWIFYELSADALANSYLMQHKYGKYIPDFNGQSPSYEAELSIAEQFIKDYSGDTVDDRRLAREESENLKSGLSLLLLTDNLVSRGIGNVKQSEWMVKHLRQNYPLPRKRKAPINPFDRYEIIKRFAGLEPRKDVSTAYRHVAAVALLETT